MYLPYMPCMYLDNSFRKPKLSTSLKQTILCMKILCSHLKIINVF